jgi:hypothetical protein
VAAFAAMHIILIGKTGINISPFKSKRAVFGDFSFCPAGCCDIISAIKWRVEKCLFRE